MLNEFILLFVIKNNEVLKVNEKKENNKVDENALLFLCNLSSLISDCITKITELGCSYYDNCNVTMDYAKLIVDDLLKDGRLINKLMIDKISNIIEDNHYE